MKNLASTLSTVWTLPPHLVKRANDVVSWSKHPHPPKTKHNLKHKWLQILSDFHYHSVLNLYSSSNKKVKLLWLLNWIGWEWRILNGIQFNNQAIWSNNQLELGKYGTKNDVQVPTGMKSSFNMLLYAKVIWKGQGC